jgi:predicted phage terminase large subunit-like protein
MLNTQNREIPMNQQKFTPEQIARSSLLSYVGLEYPKYIAEPMHELIATALEKVDSGEIRRLIICTAPQHGKTFLTSEFFPAWFLGRHPDWSLIAVTYNQTRANQVGKTVRNNLLSPTHKAIFPNCTILQDTKSAHHVATAQKGHYYSIGVGGSVMGRSAHLVLIDDPLRGREDAESKLIREKMKEWYAASIYTRLRPDNRIVIISTRWHCFHKDTLILTTNGWTPAKDIKKESLFITQKGIEPIKRMESKHFSGPMYEFTLYGTPKKLKVTGNHKILTNNGWKYAEQITKDDWLIVPKIDGVEIPNFESPKKSKAKSSTIKLTGVQNKVPKKELEILLKQGKTYGECASHFGYKHRGVIYQYATLYGLNRNTNTVASQKMLCDSNFWRLVGYWLAEGSLSKARKHYDENHYTIIVLTIGSHEQWIADDIKNILGSYNINVSTSLHKHGSALKVQFSCWQIAQYLKTHFKCHASKKQLPEWISSLPNESKKELITGYFRGDGCFSNKLGYRVSSTSLKLLTDLQRLFTTLKIPSGIMKAKKEGIEVFKIKKQKEEYIIKVKNSYELRVHEAYVPWLNIKREKYEIRKNKPTRITGKRIQNDQLQLKVKKIEVIQYDGIIYDFETESHTITAAGVVVHNSDDLTGYLLSEHPQENWKVIELRAIAEEDDILGRPIGAALCPNIYTLEHLEQVKKIEGSYNWESLYQQRPIARKGGIIQYEWIDDNWYDKVPETEVTKTIISWDTAFRKDELNDPTAASVWKITKNGYYLIHILNERLAFHQIIKKVRELHAEFKPSAHLIEGRATGQPIIDELKRLTTLPIIEVSTQNLDKEVRLDSVSGLFESGKVHFPERAPWLIEAKDQLCLFPSYKFDDIVDSVVHFLRWTNKPRYVRKKPSQLNWK